ncbi:MAG: hypothetical protein JWP81_3031 [Ferruginibacter sp.]|nr:hypothetical protein [Ferruginibacter sp.]
MIISNNSVVSIRYIMKNAKDEILENTVDSVAVYYLHGSGGILPQLQEQLEGLKTGDRKLVSLNTSSGLTGEDFIFEVIIDEVRAATNEEVLLGYALAVSPTQCGGDCDCHA